MSVASVCGEMKTMQFDGSWSEPMDYQVWDKMREERAPHYWVKVKSWHGIYEGTNDEWEWQCVCCRVRVSDRHLGPFPDRSDFQFWDHCGDMSDMREMVATKLAPLGLTLLGCGMGLPSVEEFAVTTGYWVTNHDPLGLLGTPVDNKPAVFVTTPLNREKIETAIARLNGDGATEAGAEGTTRSMGPSEAQN